MKRLVNSLLFILFSAGVFAQIPQKMTYQAVIRDASNVLVSNALVGMQVSILQGSASGTAVYVETHQPTSNINGLVTIEIGAGTPLTGTFGTIDWSTGIFFVKTETDPAGGTNYTITGTSQLLSVPYALYAETSGSQLPGPDGKSAYQVWLDLGNTGTEADFIASLTGPVGTDGKSAYQVWLDLGNTGTEADFIATLTGPQGLQGVPGTNGTNGTNGVDGTDGDGAYTNWLNQGNTGTEADFLATLVGAQGPPGATLVNGGKHTLILTDDVTDAQAAQQIIDEVGPNTQEVLIDGCTVLTTLDLSMLTKVVRISILNCSELINLNLGALNFCYDLIDIQNCPKLVNLNLSTLTKISKGSLKINNTAIPNLNLGALVSATTIEINNNADLQTVTLNNLQYVITFTVTNNNSLLSIASTVESYPPIFYDPAVYVNGYPSPTYNLNNNKLLTSISLPNLRMAYWMKCGYNPKLTDLILTSLDSVTYYLDCTGDSALVNVDFSSMKSSGNLTFNNCTSLVSLNLPVYVTNSSKVGPSPVEPRSLYFTNCTNLSSINWPNFVPSNLNSIPFIYYDFSNCKFDVSGVNTLLNKFASNSIVIFASSRVLKLQGQTPPAPPSGQGITDKADLIAKNWTVTTD